MAAWTFTTSGAAIFKAGANANSTAVADRANLGLLNQHVESYICDVARVDLVTNYSSLTANGREILGMIASSWIALHIIKYNTANYRSLAEAQTMLDVLTNDIRNGLKLIEEDKVKTYLSAT